MAVPLAVAAPARGAKAVITASAKIVKVLVTVILVKAVIGAR